jgi:ADP-ribose pyrophosphatase
VDTSLAGGVHGMSDEQEDILTVVLPAQVFIDRVRSGEINDLKTLVAGYWFADHRGRAI